LTLTFSEQTKTAYLFPGQGAQVVGMGKDLYQNSRAARDIFEQVDDALGRSLSTILFEGPEDLLRDTINAQPGIMAVSLACMEAIKENLDQDDIPVPFAMAGHSLGEYTALSAAGILNVKDVSLLVQKRGELMQEACEKNPGTMAAILGLDEVVLQEIAKESGTYVSNVNTNEQIVISGSNMGIARAMDLATARGAKKVIPLRVGGAFHSGLMEPAKAGLVEALESIEFRKSDISIIANCTGDAINSPEEIKQELVSQIAGCVQWKRSVDHMIRTGVNNFVEIGPGRALTGMVKRIDRKANTTSVSDIESILALSR
tara:strand:+ start:2692 stop:3639 length:948 start_codon:yes stop_codon:yes gene_type:complete